MVLAAAAVVAALLGGCGGDDDTDVTAAASSLCADLQTWVDRVERTSKELSDRTTADPDGSDRKRYFEAWADEVLALTEDVRERVDDLDLPVPVTGLDDGVEILEASRDEIAAFPEDDPERLGYRVAQVFLAMENVFAKTRTSVERLGADAGDPELTRALVEEPACRDYNDPLT
jgi:hypothetical protein